MIMLLGDLHGEHWVLQEAIERAIDENAKALIQVGDFGLFPKNEEKFCKITEKCRIPVYFIDGNHDDCTRWKNFEGVGKVFGNSNLYYIPRGSVLNIDGRTIAFMGGAASIDKKIRLQRGWDWDENEEVTQEQCDVLLKNAEGKTVDIFITHCPPDSIINEHFDGSHKLWFGVPITWHDPSQTYIEEVWRNLGTPHVYSGHMHRFVQTPNATILDINQTLKI